MPNKNVIGPVLIISLTFIFSIIGGCLENPSDGGPDFSSIPELILDYEIERGCFKIFVKSAVGDYKYMNIKIQVNENTSEENNTFVLSQKFTGESFNLYVEATVDVKTIYFTEVSVSMKEDEENNIFVNIIDTTDIIEEEIPVYFEDLPWKKILEQKE